MIMASGGRSTDKTSHIVRTVQCEPCVYKEIVKEARTYCRQCKEHMCDSCTSTHNSLKICRHHKCTTVTGSDFPLSEEAGIYKPALSYCSKHGDEAIEWFCEKHETMVCDTCIRNKHRECQVMSVSDVKLSVQGQSLEDIFNSLISMKSRIAKLKSGREMSADNLKNFKESCKGAVQQFKSSVIEKVERLEKEILADVDKVVTTETVIIQDQVNKCDSLIADVETALTTADGAKTASDDSDSVIATYKLVKTREKLKTMVSDLDQGVYDVHIAFHQSSKLTNILGGVDQLGTLEIYRTEVSVYPSVSASRSVCLVSGRKPLSDMEVVSSTDINVPSNDVKGSAVMPDGRIVLADCENKRIIVLNQDFTMHSKLKLPGKPNGVAVYGDNAVVVTMPDREQLQYVHVDTKLRAGNILPIGQRCWGVAVHGSEIYVGVKDNLDAGHVRVLNTRGEEIRSFGLEYRGSSCITVGRGGRIHTAESCGGHRCYSNAGHLKYEVTHEGMYNPRGILVDDNDNMIACCWDSGDIHIVENDGAHRVILSCDDGVISPQSVSYRRSDQTLIVTMWNSPSCRAYKLK